MRQKDNMKTSSTVPGIIVISVFTTNLVSWQRWARCALPWRRTWCRSWCDWARRCCATPRPRRECCAAASCGRWGRDVETSAARRWGRQVCVPKLSDHQTLPAVPRWHLIRPLTASIDQVKCECKLYFHYHYLLSLLSNWNIIMHNTVVNNSKSNKYINFIPFFYVKAILSYSSLPSKLCKPGNLL